MRVACLAAICALAACQTKSSDEPPAPKDSRIKRVHVVGAGTMGGDIAAWCALRGLDVTVQERAQQYVEPALNRARELFGKRLRAPGEADAALKRLRVDLAAAEAGSADLVIEAIVEKADAKRTLFAELEPRLPAGALIATNTSSIRLESLAGALREPGRFVGLHFFNPVASLPLVEVIRGEQTSDAALRDAMSAIMEAVPAVFLYTLKSNHGVNNRITWSPRPDGYKYGQTALVQS